MPQLSDHHMASPSITSFFDTDHDHHPYHHLFNQQSSVSSSIPPPPFDDDYSPESTFAKSMCSSSPSMKHGNIRRRPQRKQRKSVRWGSAYNYESTTNPDDFAIMWYNVRVPHSSLSLYILLTSSVTDHIFTSTFFIHPHNYKKHI